MGIFGSRSFDCAVQGCQATTQQPFKEGHTANWDFFQGKCATHGKWAVCRTHGYPYIKSGTGWYKHIWGDWNQVQKREICPVCWWETPEGRDRAEAQRRNAERERLEQEILTEREAAFRSQGYDSEAATALARRQLREQDSKAGERWDAYSIRHEREAVELQRKLEVGQAARCPTCGRYVAASQWVILDHERHLVEYEYGLCPGSGTLAER